MKTIPLWEDTSPEAAQRLIELYRNMPAARKLRQVEELTRAVQQLALARLRAEDPGASDDELDLRLASLWLPAEVVERVRVLRDARRVAR